MTRQVLSVLTLVVIFSAGAAGDLGAAGDDLSAAAKLCEVGETLETLGLADESQQTLELAEQVEVAAGRRLADKLQRLSDLEREVQQLRQEIIALGGAPGASVMVSVEVFEVDPLHAANLSGGSGTGVEKPAGGSELSVEPPSVGVCPKETVRTELDRLIAAGHAKRIASPSLVTKEGQSAVMHSGGEFPVLVPQGGDRKSIQFRQFGVRLEAVPRRVSEQRWSLDLQLENSERDFANQVNVGGVHVPGLKTVATSFRCELDDRETIVTRMPASLELMAEGQPVKTPKHLVVTASVEEIAGPGQVARPIPTY